MRSSIALAVLTVAFIAQAEESVELEERARVTLNKGRVELQMGGQTTWSLDLPNAGVDGPASLKKYDLGGGTIAIHARFEIEKNKASEAIFLRYGTKKSLKTIWKMVTGFKGDINERTSPAARFDDLNGDGLPEIAIGQILESVRLCGKQELPLLFRKVFDTKKKVFRSVLARRPGLKPPVDIGGSFEPGEGPTEPLVKQALPRAVSRTAGDQGETLLLTPPRVLIDDDPATAWVPVPGNGAGEFVSFNLLVNAYGVNRIGIRPLPVVPRLNRYDRPRTVLLVTENRVYRLNFSADPLDQPEKMVWFDLPEPDQTNCFSLIVETSFASSPRRPMALAELTVLTEADGPDGLKVLAKDLSSAERRRQAAMLLERAGPRAVPAIREVWPKLDWQGKKRAVMVLAGAGPAEGADLLAEAAVEGDPAIVNTARRGLKAAGDAAVSPLAVYLESTLESRFQAAVELLASLDVGSALDALIAATGQGGSKRRSLLRSRIALAARRAPERAENLWVRIVLAEEKNEKERLLDLLRVGAGLDDLKEKVAELTVRIYGENSAFADRYRLLQVMGLLECHGPVDHLAEAALDPDQLIRAVAISGLGACIDGKKDRAKLIIAALEDGAPEVRMVGLGVIGKMGIVHTAVDRVAELAGSDPWPDVRALSAAAARYLPYDLAIPILEQTHRDPSSRVRKATLESAIAVPGERVDRIIKARLEAKDEKPRLKKIAARAAGIRCQSGALPALFEVLRKGSEPLANEKDIFAALAAARAMGAIGGPEAEELLTKARSRSNPVTDKAIDNALATLGEPCETKPSGPLKK
ncbi:MAG: hypothetical protein GY847_04695 [Proteobacteria bacterium]|nr:hypothetical protein [Pseudomonadota bacterium]